MTTCKSACAAECLAAGCKRKALEDDCATVLPTQKRVKACWEADEQQRCDVVQASTRLPADIAAIAMGYQHHFLRHHTMRPKAVSQGNDEWELHWRCCKSGAYGGEECATTVYPFSLLSEAAQGLLFHPGALPEVLFDGRWSCCQMPPGPYPDDHVLRTGEHGCTFRPTFDPARWKHWQPWSERGTCWPCCRRADRAAHGCAPLLAPAKLA